MKVKHCFVLALVLAVLVFVGYQVKDATAAGIKLLDDGTDKGHVYEIDEQGTTVTVTGGKATVDNTVLDHVDVTNNATVGGTLGITGAVDAASTMEVAGTAGMSGDVTLGASLSFSDISQVLTTSTGYYLILKSDGTVAKSASTL